MKKITLAISSFVLFASMGCKTTNEGTVNIVTEKGAITKRKVRKPTFFRRWMRTFRYLTSL